MDYVARLLLWDEYVQSVGKVRWPRFGTTYVVEELSPTHAAFVQEHSDRVVRLELRSAGVTPAGQPACRPALRKVHNGSRMRNLPSGGRGGNVKCRRRFPFPAASNTKSPGNIASHTQSISSALRSSGSSKWKFCTMS